METKLVAIEKIVDAVERKMPAIEKKVAKMPSIEKKVAKKRKAVKKKATPAKEQPLQPRPQPQQPQLALQPQPQPQQPQLALQPQPQPQQPQLAIQPQPQLALQPCLIRGNTPRYGAVHSYPPAPRVKRRRTDTQRRLWSSRGEMEDREEMRQMIGHTHNVVDRVHGVLGRTRSMCIDAADMSNYSRRFQERKHVAPQWLPHTILITHITNTEQTCHTTRIVRE